MNQDDFGVEAEQPPPAYVSEAPPAHHLFGALRLHEAVASITDSNAHTSEVLHDSLVKVLDEIINDRLASSHQPELGKVFETWKKEVLDRLDGRVTISGGQIVTHNYGFNYYYSPNWKNVISYFEGLRGRKDWKKTLVSGFLVRSLFLWADAGRQVKIVDKNGPLKNFTVKQILKDLKLDVRSGCVSYLPLKRILTNLCRASSTDGLRYSKTSYFVFTEDFFYTVPSKTNSKQTGRNRSQTP